MPLSSDARKSLELRLQRYEKHREKISGYLTDRGLGADTAQRFRLGYVEPDEQDPKKYWHRLALPYITPAGVVQIRFRCLLPHHDKGQDDHGCPKYLGDAGAEITLFNAATLLDATDTVFLTEGEFDAIAVEMLAGFPAVGIPGAQAWGKHAFWSRCFVGLSRIILPADGDAAGAQLAEAVAKTIPEVRIVELPDGEDANSLLSRDPSDFFTRCGLNP